MKTLFSLVAAAAVMLGMVSAPALAGDRHGNDGHRNGQRDWDHQGNNSGWRNYAHDNGNHGRYRGSYGNSRGDYYRNDGRHHGDGGYRGDNRADYRGDYRDYYRPNYYRPAPHVVYRPVPAPYWRRGGYYYGRGYAPTYVVNDWGNYGLYAPPSGYYWRRSDAGDFLLVAITTGIITNLILHH